MQRVLVLCAGGSAGVKRFKQYGSGELAKWPRYSQAYPYYGALLAAGVKVDVISAGDTGVTDRKGRNPPGNWKAYLGTMSQVRLLSHYDVVVGWALNTACLAAGPARMIGQNRKIAHISFFTYHNPATSIRERLRQRIFRSAVRWAGKTILMTRRQVNEAIIDANCEVRRAAYLPVGVDTQFFRPDARPNTNGISSELRTLQPMSYVVVAGDQLRVESEYLAMLTDLGVGLVRLTQNRYAQQFWHDAVRRGDANFPVTCIANLSAVEVRYAYQNALCALNYIDNTEQPAGWSVLTEAMACGLPVVATKGLATEELRSYFGTKDEPPFEEVSHSNIDETRCRISELKSQDTKRQEMGRSARAFVEKHLNIDRTSRIAMNILIEASTEFKAPTYTSAKNI